MIRTTARALLMSLVGIVLVGCTTDYEGVPSSFTLPAATQSAASHLAGYGRRGQRPDRPVRGIRGNTAGCGRADAEDGSANEERRGLRSGLRGRADRRHRRPAVRLPGRGIRSGPAARRGGPQERGQAQGRPLGHHRTAGRLAQRSPGGQRSDPVPGHGDQRAADSSIGEPAARRADRLPRLPHRRSDAGQGRRDDLPRATAANTRIYLWTCPLPAKQK